MRCNLNISIPGACEEGWKAYSWWDFPMLSRLLRAASGTPAFVVNAFLRKNRESWAEGWTLRRRSRGREACGDVVSTLPPPHVAVGGAAPGVGRADGLRSQRQASSVRVIRHKWVQERCTWEQGHLLGCQATHGEVDTYTRVPFNPGQGGPFLWSWDLPQRQAFEISVLGASLPPQWAT